MNCQGSGYFWTIEFVAGCDLSTQEAMENIAATSAGGMASVGAA